MVYGILITTNLTFFPFMERAHKANPVVLTGEPALIFSTNEKTSHEFIPLVEICPNDPINVEMGLTARV